MADQTQKQGMYRMPVQIGITLPPQAPAANANPVARIMLDRQRNELVIPLETAPLEVKFDPDGWVTMMQATFTRK